MASAQQLDKEYERKIHSHQMKIGCKVNKYIDGVDGTYTLAH